MKWRALRASKRQNSAKVYTCWTTHHSWGHDCKNLLQVTWTILHKFVQWSPKLNTANSLLWRSESVTHHLVDPSLCKKLKYEPLHLWLHDPIVYDVFARLEEHMQSQWLCLLRLPLVLLEEYRLAYSFNSLNFQ